MAGGDPGRLDDARHGEDGLADRRRARDPGGRREHEPAHELRPPLGEPERHHAAERMADDVDRADPLLVAQGREDVGEPGQGRGRRQRRRAAVARQVGDQQPPAREERRQLREVPGRAAEAVDEQQRRAGLTGDEVAEPRPAPG